MDRQMSFFDYDPVQMETMSSGKIEVVKAEFKEAVETGWRDLFSGYDELYGITFSSGIDFMEKVFDEFEHIEMIFGCEGVMDEGLAAAVSMQAKTLEKLVKCKIIQRIAQRISDGSVDISVSRDTRSHEKIFILKSNDGRTRVITGSANMSASAFLGVQREDIICFDGADAYEYYKDRFDRFKERCADSVSEKVILMAGNDGDYVKDNITEVPILKTVEKKNIVILEPADEKNNDDAEIVADIKGMEAEIKPLLPKMKPENGKILITGEITKAFKRKYDESTIEKKSKERKVPKLHIDFENERMIFNGKEQNLCPDRDKVAGDIESLTGFISSLSSFHGDFRKSQEDYYKFFNWYFCSPFMPYLRYVGNSNEYGVTPFPVFGILYGDSNGGKTTFVRLLSKLMAGVKIPLNSSSDFTGTNINYLKCACEGLPINIDDLAKTQYDSNFEKVIKDDGWGISERYINYPAVTISTNKLASLKPDISKRVVTCRIDIRIDKDQGARNSKKINECMKQATNALFCEYVRRMFANIHNMVEEMTGGSDDYFPDILKASSDTLLEIFSEYCSDIPDYITSLSYSDYFGDLAIGRHAIEKIRTAWQTEPKMFSVDKKKNKLIYTYPDGGRLYELKYLQEELPSALEAEVTAGSLVMKLDVAKEIFGVSFNKGLFGQIR